MVARFGKSRSDLPSTSKDHYRLLNCSVHQIFTSHDLKGFQFRLPHLPQGA
jgi:hypothetical protein